MTGLSLRQEIDHHIASNAAALAAARLGELWQKEASPSTAGFVVSRYERLRSCVSLLSHRAFILRSFTIEPVIPLLRAAAFVNGIDLIVQTGDFNAYAQEILDPASRLYQFEPDIGIWALQTRDVAPELWEQYADLSPAEATGIISRVVTLFRDLIQTFRSHSQAPLIVHTLEMPPFVSQGILDRQLGASQAAAVEQINAELRNLAKAHIGVYILDYDALIARHGRTRWYDERKWLVMRMPIAAEHLMDVANEWLRFVHPLTGKVCKVLVTDLDNTLWGGVVGEDGVEGIKVNSDYPGAAYRTLQRTMLDLYRRGIILAICSKNNLSDAMAVLESHQGMLLRLQHFAALRINWDDKVENLRAIAAELNVGIDTLAFLDDNPVERARVRTELPAVTVIELPDDPMGYALALRNTPVFERLSLSSEDHERGRYYAEQRQRLELERNVASLEGFYEALQQEVKIAPVTSETLVRVAQLTQKTNQFNLTTRRYSEQQIAEMAASPNWGVYTLGVKDRFGDNGIVGVAITHDTEDVSEIDTFLLSCRVIGRTVETALLAFLVKQSRARGKTCLQGWFIPTKKNTPAKEFYSTHKFRLLTERGGETLWSVDVRDTEIACPPWIRLILSGEASAS
jgi:FkbH-like protein